MLRGDRHRRLTGKPPSTAGTAGTARTAAAAARLPWLYVGDTVEFRGPPGNRLHAARVKYASADQKRFTVRVLSTGAVFNTPSQRITKLIRRDTSSIYTENGEDAEDGDDDDEAMVEELTPPPSPKPKKKKKTVRRSPPTITPKKRRRLTQTAGRFLAPPPTLEETDREMALRMAKGLRGKPARIAKTDLSRMSPSDLVTEWRRATPAMLNVLKSEAQLVKWMHNYPVTDLAHNPSTVGRAYMMEMLRLLPTKYELRGGVWHGRTVAATTKRSGGSGPPHPRLVLNRHPNGQPIRVRWYYHFTPCDPKVRNSHRFVTAHEYWNKKQQSWPMQVDIAHTDKPVSLAVPPHVDGATRDLFCWSSDAVDVETYATPELFKCVSNHPLQQYEAENPDQYFYVPKAGGSWWTRNSVVELFGKKKGGGSFHPSTRRGTFVFP